MAKAFNAKAASKYPWVSQREFILDRAAEEAVISVLAESMCVAEKAFSRYPKSCPR